MKKNYLFAFLIMVLSLRAAAQCSTPLNTPFFEGFSGITANNQFPACWAASNPSVTCLTFTNPTQSANRGAFLNTPTGDNYFYSPGIQLYASVIYSVSAWHITSTPGSGWTFSMLHGTSQSTTGLTPIASAAPNSAGYVSVANTFTVATSGMYYLALKGTSTSGAPQYLYFDEVSISVPCSVNSPTLSSIAGTSVFCQGQAYTFSISGADTYTWSNGATGSVVTLIPSGSLGVTGTRTLTGCSVTINKPLALSPAPVISIFGNNQVCEGFSTTLTAFGTANGYTWSTTGLPGSTTTVMPLSNSIYTVLGKTSFGCIGSATVDISVLPLPTVSVTATNTMPCAGETVTLTGTGASSYIWMQGTNLQTATAITITPTAQTLYVLTGTDANGCINSSNFTMNVTICTGIDSPKNIATGGIYPNPNNGCFTIRLNGSALKTIAIIDVTGRVVFSQTTADDAVDVDLSRFADGLYYATVSSGSSTETFKIIKK